MQDCVTIEKGGIQLPEALSEDQISQIQALTEAFLATTQSTEPDPTLISLLEPIEDETDHTTFTIEFTDAVDRVNGYLEFLRTNEVDIVTVDS